MCNDPFFASPGLGRQFNAGFPGAVLVLPLEASTGARRVSDLPCWDSGRFLSKLQLEHLQQNVQGGSLTRVFLELWSFSLWKRPQEPDVSVTCRLGLAFVYILNCFLNIYCLIKIALFKLALALKKLCITCAL